MLTQEDTRYAYAVGKIRALEGHLLDRSRFEDMIGSRDAEEALKLLSDTDYGAHISALEKGESFERALGVELKNTLELLVLLSCDGSLTDVFRLRYDFHNLKVLLKKKNLSREKASSFDENLVELLDMGIVDTKSMQEAIEEDSFQNLPKELSGAAKGADENFRETREPWRIDTFLDKALYKLTIKRVKDNPFLKKYFQTFIDLTNIRSFLRAGELKKDKDFFAEVFLEGGELGETFFLAAFEESRQNFLTRIRATSYGEKISEGIRISQEENSWSKLEKEIDNYLLGVLRSARYVVFGLEPVVSYFLARENEIKNIRLVIVGKLNKIPEEKLKMRLRETY